MSSCQKHLTEELRFRFFVLYSLKLIDCHLHLSELPEDGLNNYAMFNGLSYTLNELLELMENSGVEQGLLLSPPLKQGSIVPNERILELCGKSQEKLFPIVTVEPSEKEVGDSI